ncbi:hypothetical protein [Clostridium sp. 'White wine YQ']|uniref:hypothetical protein n=1 Tax=Clostridium sp. 'White wine YQ' TaxID=3027474 RepID=UPI002366BA5D|nr:hypothetical protein [Clostridium sp. 'White wine YQ']MDD7793731.1 hypothetical protein [Clostridium sp. 'White wine YQ']
MITIISLILLIAGIAQISNAIINKKKMPLPKKGNYKVMKKTEYNTILFYQRVCYGLCTLIAGSSIFFTKDVRFLLLLIISPVAAFIFNLVAINKKYVVFK